MNSELLYSHIKDAGIDSVTAALAVNNACWIISVNSGARYENARYFPGEILYHNGLSDYDSSWRRLTPEEVSKLPKP